MSDPGSTGMPPPSRPVPSVGDRAQASRADTLRILSATGELAQLVRAERIAGEVVAQNKDGSVLIRTEKGDITAQPQRPRPDLIIGERVQVELPPGRPPRQATVRDTPPQENTPRTDVTRTDAPRTDATRTDAPRTDAPRTDTPRTDTPPPARDTATRPETPRVRPGTVPEQASAVPPGRPAPVTPEQIVRILPLTPQQAQQIIRPPAAPVNVTLPVPLQFIPPHAATQIAEAAVNAQTQQLAQTILSAPASQVSPQALPPAPPLALLNNTPPLATNPAPSSASATAPQAHAAAMAATPQTTMPLLAYLLQANQPPSTGTMPPLTAQSFAPPTLPPLVQFMAEAILPQAQAMPPAPQLNNGALHLMTPAPLVTGPLMTPPPTTDFTALPAPLATPAAAQALPALPDMPKADIKIIDMAPATVRLVDPRMNMPPQAHDNALPPALPGRAGTMQAVVQGMTLQNLPVIAIAFPELQAQGLFVMQFPADNLGTGQTLTVMPQPGHNIMAAAAHAAAAPVPLAQFLTPGIWPALDDMFTTLQTAAPQTAQALLQNAIPSAAASPARLTAIAMLFIAFAGAGDLPQWMGEKATDTLRRLGKTETLARITRDGGALSRLAGGEAPAQSTAQDWRSLPIPLYWDNHIEKMILHYRHDRDSDSPEGEEKKGTRFILDIVPSRMGRVQLDGLHRPALEQRDKNARLDLIVRTKEPVSANMQQQMRRLYVDVLQQSAMSGEMSFQHKAESWIEVG